MPSQEILANATRLGPVHLRVVDIPAALPVWRDVVGLATLSRNNGTAELGVDGRTLIVLHGEATTVQPPKSRDLFHVAIHVTTRKELARVVALASVARRLGEAHMPSLQTGGALELSDPEGNPPADAGRKRLI